MVTTNLYPNIIVSVSGAPKTGKTHFALTFPDPIRVYSFDYGTRRVVGKFSKKKIDVAEFELPIIETDSPKPWAEKVWLNFKTMYEGDLADGKYATYVIDTATALWQVIAQAVTEEKNRKKILEVEYYVPNLRMGSVITRAQVAGVNLVLIQHIRDRYVNGQNTGELEPDGWKRTSGRADVDLWVESAVKGKDNVSRFTIKGNWFDRRLNGQSFDDLDYETLMTLLGVG